VASIHFRHWRGLPPNSFIHLPFSPLPFPPFASMPYSISRKAAPASPPPRAAKLEGLGKRSNLSSGFGRSPTTKRVLVHFSSKFPHLVRLIAACCAVEACWKSTRKGNSKRSFHFGGEGIKLLGSTPDRTLGECPPCSQWSDARDRVSGFRRTKRRRD